MRSQHAFSQFRGKSSHTAHIPGSGAIHYRHHPLFGEEVEVLRRCRRDAVDCVMIVVADGTRCLIPKWMLDSASCSTVVDQDTPTIAFSALCSLRDLLDATSSGSREASSVQGGSCDAKATNQSGPVDVPMANRELNVETTATKTAGALPGTVVPTASSGRRKANRKEQ